MSDNEIQDKNNEIVTRFLKTNFNTRRVKINGTFKRAIVIEQGFSGKNTFYLHPKMPNYKTILYSELHQIVKDVFGYENSEIDLIVYRFVNP